MLDSKIETCLQFIAEKRPFAKAFSEHKMERNGESYTNQIQRTWLRPN